MGKKTSKKLRGNAAGRQTKKPRGKPNSSSSGDRAWGDTEVNIVLGCANRCRYCFARTAAKRFGRIRADDDWGTTYHRLKKGKDYKSGECYGTVRFPTTHDITPDFLESCVAVMQKLLAGGNDVIVCSKPRLECIKRLCAEFADNLANIEFRFTVGAMDDAILRFWEPGASNFQERLNCLKYAFRKGFKTSVNIEPMLDAPNVSELFHRLVPYVNVFINIGIMKRVGQNVRPRSRREKAEVRKIKENQSPNRIRSIYEVLKGKPLVRWSPETKRILAVEKEAACK